MKHPKKVRRTVKQHFAFFSIKIVGYKPEIRLNIGFMPTIHLQSSALNPS